MIRFSSALLLLTVCLLSVPVHAQEQPGAGTVAPDFQLPSIHDGGQVALHEALGRGTVIVHFWKSK